MSDREPWQPRQTGEEKLADAMRDVEEIAMPQPWGEPDPMQPVAEKLLEAYRLNRLSMEQDGE